MRHREQTDLLFVLAWLVICACTVIVVGFVYFGFGTGVH